MPCLCPSPERGRTTAASPGSARWIAMPLGTSSAAPGASVSGASMQARRSRPAAPALAYWGRLPRRRGSRILTSRVFKTMRRSAPRQHLRDVLDQLAREHDLRRAREAVLALVVEQRERIGVLAERVLHAVRRDQRDVLLRALGLRVRVDVLGLGGEADAERRLLQARDLGEDVGIGLE